MSETRKVEYCNIRRKSIGHKICIFPEELSEEQIDEITRSFEILDTNKDGRISKSDIIKATRSFGMDIKDEDAEAMIAAGATDTDGFISLSEYAVMMKERYVPIDIESARMKAAFDIIDKNKDGFISLDEFKCAILHKDDSLSDAEVKKYFDEVDTNGDGKISYKEFVASSLCSRVF